MTFTDEHTAGEGAGPRYVLAFDTANEVIAIGVGALDVVTRSIAPVAWVEEAARRASNTKLLPTIDDLLRREGIARDAIACVCAGRGPGSFTGVRIAMATAKGIASALEVPLVGVSSIDAVAWNSFHAGVRGELLVTGDAMRKEVYPVRYRLSDDGVHRLTKDMVIKAEAFVESAPTADFVSGDGLAKFADWFASIGELRPPDEWAPTGRGLLAALQDAWQRGEVHPLDPGHDPAILLPVYTRLSDAEEAERARIARADHAPRDLHSGVQGDARVTEGQVGHTAEGSTKDAAVVVDYLPLDAAHAEAVAAMESEIMGSDAWSSALVADELPRKDRIWWMALSEGSGERRLVGYAGALVVDGDMQVLKVGVDPSYRRQGIARKLLEYLAYDATNLAAITVSLEVRAANAGAISFYEILGMTSLGRRPRYYSDGEDALIMQGDLAGLLPRNTAGTSVAGIEMDIYGSMPRDEAAMTTAACAMPRENAVFPDSDEYDDPGIQNVNAVPAYSESRPHPLILAIETSCDETAASVIDGAGVLLSDVVASQIDFHARFGGVVPEIASRKHVEAICGVSDVALEKAGESLGCADDVPLRFRDLDAVACTYAPGLVGALVVGVAFAKGVAWGANIPFIGVNHLEGHLYANKLAAPTFKADARRKADFEPPAVVSLVSGGNTMLVYMRDWGDYEVLGTTIDDAVGEAFDKVAKALGLPYPGGPHISKLAEAGDASAVDLPRAMLHSGDYRFSLSGLKTAVILAIDKLRDAEGNLSVQDIANICASFQQAVIDVQVAKARTALEETGAPTFCFGGGVAANPELREAYEAMCDQLGVQLFMPPLSACGDNAAMIALVALDRYRQGKFFDLDADAFAHADLNEQY